MASASVLLPDPDGPTTSSVCPARQLERDAVERRPIGAPVGEPAGRGAAAVARRPARSAVVSPGTPRGRRRRAALDAAPRAAGDEHDRGDRHQHARGRAGPRGRRPRSRAPSRGSTPPAALATAAIASTGNDHERYSVNAKTSSAAAPWTNPDRSVSTPHWLPRSADTPAATISANSAAPGLRTISGASTAGHEPDRVEQVLEPAARTRTRPRGAAPAQVPGPEDDAEGDADDGGDDDVARPPAGVRAGGQRRPAIAWWSSVPNLLDAAQCASPAAGTASTSRRACFLRRYEPDQVPRVCGSCHTLSARGAPRRRCSVVADASTLPNRAGRAIRAALAPLPCPRGHLGRARRSRLRAPLRVLRSEHRGGPRRRRRARDRHALHPRPGPRDPGRPADADRAIR